MNRKFPFVAALIIIMLFFFMLMSSGGGNTPSTSLTPQGLLGGTSPPGVAISPTAEVFVQLDGQLIQPQLGPITTVIEPNTLWVLKDLWEDYHCASIDGRNVCYDWGFYCQLGGTRCIVAECQDPFWDLPTPGMVYTANPQSAASTSMVLLPPTDIPAPEEGWQKFLSIYEILNTGLATSTPTPTIPAVTVPGATSFAVLPGTPQATGSGIPLSTLLKWCIPVVILMLIVVAFVAIRNRRSS